MSIELKKGAFRSVFLLLVFASSYLVLDFFNRNYLAFSIIFHVLLFMCIYPVVMVRGREFWKYLYVVASLLGVLAS